MYVCMYVYVIGHSPLGLAATNSSSFNGKIFRKKSMVKKFSREPSLIEGVCLIMGSA